MTLYRISKTEDPKRSIPPPAEPRLRTKSPRELYISICLGKLGYEMHRILLTPPPKYLQYKDPYHAPCCFLADSSYYLQEYKYNPLKTSQWRPRRSWFHCQIMAAILQVEFPPSMVVPYWYHDFICRSCSALHSVQKGWIRRVLRDRERQYPRKWQ